MSFSQQFANLIRDKKSELKDYQNALDHSIEEEEGLKLYLEKLQLAGFENEASSVSQTIERIARNRSLLPKAIQNLTDEIKRLESVDNNPDNPPHLVAA